MSEGTETTRTVVHEDVTVRKTVDADPAGDGTATVRLDVTAEREEPTTVRIREVALEAVASDRVDLHADHGAEHWRLDDATAVFQRTFFPGEEYTVVYRVTDVEADEVARMDADPRVDVLDPEAAGVVESVVDPTASDAVRDLIEGDRDSLLDPPVSASGSDSTAAVTEVGTDAADAADGVEVSTDPDVEVEAGTEAGVGEPDVSVPEASTAEPATVGESTSDAGASAAEPATDESAGAVDEHPREQRPADAAGLSGGVARVLVRELQSGYVDEETKADLRAALEPGRSQDVRIRHLQNQVSDFAAYAEVLEQFIDRHGTLEEPFETLEERLSTLDGDLEDVRADVDAVEGLRDDHSELSSDVAGLRDGMRDVRDDLDDLGDGHSDLAAGQTSLEERVASMEAELERVEERLGEFEDFKRRLSGVFQDATGDVSSPGLDD